MATGSGAGRVEKAQAQLLDGKKSAEAESRYAGKVQIQGRKGEKDQMYDSRYDVRKDDKGVERIEGEWLYKDGSGQSGTTDKTRKSRT